MPEIKIWTEEKIVKLSYVELEGKKFNLSEVLSLLDDLDNTNNSEDMIGNLYNKELEGTLEKIGVLKYCTKYRTQDSLCQGENYETFKKEFEAKLYGENVENENVDRKSNDR